MHHRILKTKIIENKKLHSISQKAPNSVGLAAETLIAYTDGVHPNTKSGANINRGKDELTKKDIIMRKIQNTNISFRATTDLKQRLTDYCLEHDLHNSSVIRQALNSYLRQETKAKVPSLIAEQQCSSGPSRLR